MLLIVIANQSTTASFQLSLHIPDCIYCAQKDGPRPASGCGKSRLRKCIRYRLQKLKEILLPCSSHSMIAARWRNFRCISSSIQYIPWRGCRWQGTTATTSPAISPALLERARALTAEHVQLSKSLNDEYDSQLAKKIGSLSAVATAFNAWESTKNVGLKSIRTVNGD